MNSARISLLIESLPWLFEFKNKILVVKIGGSILDTPGLLQTFAQDIAYLHTVGLRPVVVHGGGPQISAYLERMQVQTEFRDGLRVTTPESMQVVRMVLTGQINREIVNRINRVAPIAVSICGEDANMFTAAKVAAGQLGQVGEITAVDTSLLRSIIASGCVPVVSSVARDHDDPEGSLNINADSAASAVAVALGAAKLLFLTDVDGLYRSWPDKSSFVSSISAAELRRLLPQLSGGIIPKMTSCLEAVEQGVPKAAIINGSIEHSVLAEIFTDRGIGTEVIP